MDPNYYFMSQFGIKELIYVGVPTVLFCGFMLYAHSKTPQIIRWLMDEPTPEQKQKVLEKIKKEMSDLEQRLK